MKLSTNNCWGLNESLLELVTPTFFNWLDSVMAASMLPSASYIKRAVFFVFVFFFFSWQIFGAGVQNWKTVSFLIFELFLYKRIKTKNACRLESAVQNGCISIRTTASGGHSGVLVFTELTGNHETQMVFCACKCFVFWSRRKDTWTESQALLNYKHFLFSSCVGGMFHL